MMAVQRQTRTIYIETSFVSYFTAKPSRNAITSNYQKITKVWWAWAQQRFDFVASALVLKEASAGNRAAAESRLAALVLVEILGADEDAEVLTQALLAQGAVPRVAADDAATLPWRLSAVSNIW